MGQLSRLLLSGLVALSLTVAAPAQAESQADGWTPPGMAPEQAAEWTANIQDVMDLVFCLVGSGDCAGLQPGADLVDITSDNDEVIAAADEAGLAMVFTGMRHFKH